MSFIEMKNICKKYAGAEKNSVTDFNLSIEEGEFIAFVGPSGCGKSTIANMLLSLIKPDSGTIEIDGTIQIIFQHPETSLDPAKKIGYSLEEPMIIHRMDGKAGRKARVRELLDLVDLGEELLDRYPHQISGGEAQRIMIARALSLDPKILILDEPTAGLDPKERVRFRNLISSLAENRIVILSTHIVSDVEYIANEILIMKNGELIQHGSPEEILKPIEKCVWECDVSRKEADELESNYVTANLKHNNGAERLRIISQEAPCRTAWNVDPTLEDLYLYYFAEVSEHE